MDLKVLNIKAIDYTALLLQWKEQLMPLGKSLSLSINQDYLLGSKSTVISKRLFISELGLIILAKL